MFYLKKKTVLCWSIGLVKQLKPPKKGERKRKKKEGSLRGGGALSTVTLTSHTPKTLTPDLE